jgi:type IV secretory pathway TrbD component
VDRLSSFGAALSTIIFLVIQAGFELAVSANLQKPILFGAQVMVAFIAGFIILSFVMLIWLARSFRLPS